MTHDDAAPVTGQRAIDLRSCECREQAAPLRGACPRGAEYRMRQIGSDAGFYGVSDWESL